MVLAILFWACADEKREGYEIQVDTLQGGRVVTWNPASKIEVFEMREELRIGRTNGGGPDVFGKIAALTVDDRGTIYVADSRGPEIKAFSSDGEFIRRFGRQGEGPGEFGSLEGIAWQRTTGLIWSMDFKRRTLSGFDTLGVHWFTHPHAREALHFSLPWVGRVDAAGYLYDLDPMTHTQVVRYRLADSLQPVDSLPIPPVLPEPPTYNVPRGRLTEVATVPFSPWIAWDRSAQGNVVLANTATLDVHEVSFSGDTIRSIVLDRSPLPLGGRDRDSIAEHLGVPSRWLPRQKTVMEDLIIGMDNYIWVDLTDHTQSSWDVFDEAGYHVGQVTSPIVISRRPRPVVSMRTLTGVTEDDLGVHYIVRLRILVP